MAEVEKILQLKGDGALNLLGQSAVSIRFLIQIITYGGGGGGGKL